MDEESRWRSCRMIFTYMACSGTFLAFSPRPLISVAIIDMAEQKGETSINGNASYIQIDERTPEFNWTKPLQGLVVSSYAIGSIAGTLPGGWYADVYGGKTLTLIMMFVSGLLSLVTPVAARIHSGLLLTVGLVIGCTSMTVVTAVSSMVGAWAPLNERSLMASLRQMGVNGSPCIIFITYGLLAQIRWDNGWPMAFYVYGTLKLIWCLAWYFLIYDSPGVHPRISESEKRYILSGGGADRSRMKNASIPWQKMAASCPLWAVLIGAFGACLATIFTVMCIPLYFSDIHTYSPLEITIYSSVVSLPFVLLPFFSGLLSDYIVNQKWLTATVTRKLFTFIATAIPVPLSLWIGYVTYQHTGLAVALLTICMAAQGGYFGGLITACVDIAPKYAGTVMGAVFFIMAMCGTSTPLFVFSVTPNGAQEEWTLVYYVLAAVYLISGTVFIICGSAEEQEWAKDNGELSALAIAGPADDPAKVHDSYSSMDGTKES